MLKKYMFMKNPIVGDKNNNYLQGTSSDDIIKGGAGNDIIKGGVGNDILFGGNGADSFIFNKKSGNDMICDFNTEKDEIILNMSINKPIEFIEEIHGTTIKVGDVEITLIGVDYEQRNEIEISFIL